MGNLAEQQNDDNGLDSSLIKKQLDAAQYAARLAQSNARKQQAQQLQMMSRSAQADSNRQTGQSAGNTKSASPLLPNLPATSAADNYESEDDDQGQDSPEDNTQGGGPAAGEARQSADPVQIAIQMAQVKQQAQQQQDQEVGEGAAEGDEEKAEGGAAKAVGLMVWWLENKKVQITTETLIGTLPENLGLPIFVLWFWWISDNLFASLVAKKKWPIEATIALLAVTMVYIFLIFLVLVVVAIIIDYLNMGPIDRIVAYWKWGFEALKWFGIFK